MSTWKQLTRTLDSSTQKFLENKRFTRQRKKFTWDWHAWNILLVSTPGFVLWACLHRVEKRMLEDEKRRQEIQEQTGVSSRGYLIPPKKLREEARDMIRHKYERPSWSFMTGKASAKAETTALPQTSGASAQVDGNERLKYSAPGILHNYALQQRLLERRLSAIEKKLDLDGGNMSLAGVLGSSDADEAMGESRTSEAPVDSLVVESGEKEGRRSSLKSAVQETTKVVTDVGSSLNAMAQEAAKVVADIGSAAATWATEEGIPQGQRLYIAARDWLERQGTETLWPARDEESQRVSETPVDEDVATARRDENDQQR